eukprot:415965-Rhodomonas_salina.1
MCIRDRSYTAPGRTFEGAKNLKGNKIVYRLCQGLCAQGLGASWVEAGSVSETPPGVGAVNAIQLLYLGPGMLGVEGLKLCLNLFYQELHACCLLGKLLVLQLAVLMLSRRKMVPAVEDVLKSSGC